MFLLITLWGKYEENVKTHIILHQNAQIPYPRHTPHPVTVTFMNVGVWLVHFMLFLPVHDNALHEVTGDSGLHQAVHYIA